mgnify:CR=1 FL=1
MDIAKLSIAFAVFVVSFTECGNKEKKQIFARAAAYLNEVYGEGTVICEIKDSYFNMKEMIVPHEHLIRNAVRAMENNQIVPKIVPIRGGTDGARLSYMGLPCPNLCTGGSNFHGKYEYISIQSMERIVAMLIDLVVNYQADEVKKQ